MREKSMGSWIVSALMIVLTATPAMAQAGGATYLLDEGQGTVATDSSPAHNDGSIEGATWTAGHSGGALHFGEDSARDRIVVPQSVFDGFTNTAYVEAWIKPASYPDGVCAGTIFRKRAHFNDWSMELRNADAYSGNLRCDLAGMEAMAWGGASVVGGFIPLSTWSKVACWYDGSTLHALINDIEIAHADRVFTPDWGPGPFAGFLQTEIGNDTLDYGVNCPDYVFRGEIDEVRLSTQPPPASNERVTLSAVRDGFLRQGAPSTNEGANQALRVQSSGKNRVLVGFDIAGVPTSGLVRATLVLRISEIADNWGAAGRTISAHRLLAPWSEGNGWTVGGNTRGSGPGATWACGTDTQIADQIDECGGTDWSGGAFAAATGSGALHTNGMTGEVSWDVTADVQAGSPYGWALVKDNESQNGKVSYHSRESAEAAGDPTLAPRLILEYP